MDLVFVLNRHIFSLEIAINLAVLRSHGYKCGILFEDVEKGGLVKKVNKLNPTMVGSYTDTFSLFNKDMSQNLAILEKIKKERPETITFLSGIHSTIYRDILKKYPFLDIAFLGDIETSISCVLERLSKHGNDLRNIRGINYRNGNECFYNGPAPLTDLNKLPFPDIDSFYKHKGAFRHGYRINVARGCPNRCTFCFQHKYSESTNANDSIMPRYYPVKFLIDVMMYLKSKDKTINLFYFTYVTFTHSKKFLREFLPKYKKLIKIPYVCATRYDKVDEEVADLLKESGCSKVSLAIESGVSRLRNDVLKKNLSDEDIYKGAKILKKKGLRLGCGILVGFPEEKIDDALASLEMAVKIKADFLSISLFKPIPNLDLTNLAYVNNYLHDTDEVKEFDWERSQLNIKDKHQFENVNFLSHLYLLFPNKTLFRIIIKLPNNRFFFLLKMTPRIIAVLRYDMCNRSKMKKIRYVIYAVYSSLIRQQRPDLVI